jgi:DNA-directed RNA polymerase II subunit RPB7
LLDTVKQKLLSEVEGTCSGKYGFIIAITTIDNIGSGMIQPGRGYVVYPVEYEAIVFRPFKGEVLDATVSQVNKIGLRCEIGPLECFVSRHCIPAEMEFDANSSSPCYKSKDEVGKLVKLNYQCKTSLKIVYSLKRNKLFRRTMKSA